MNRIATTFSKLKTDGRKALVGYLTAGDPDYATSERNIRAAIESGLDVLELGIPFSDPTADGPTIQAAARRALDAGMSIAMALKLVASLRQDYDLPIVLFGYANPLFKYGYQDVCKDAASAGADGVLVVDLPPEEADPLRAELDKCNLCFVPLIAPTTPEPRAAQILRNANGFIYYIMVTGVTGARKDIASDISAHVDQLRRHSDLPIAVGFGISNGKQARLASNSADGVVVGSALIEAAMAGTLTELVAELRAALDA